MTAKGTRPQGFRPKHADMARRATQAQAMLAEAQERAEELTVEGSAGGGAVVVTMTGAGDLEAVRIDPAVVDPDDISLLEDLVVAAVRDAHTRIDEAVGDPAGDLLADLDLGALGLQV